MPPAAFSPLCRAHVLLRTLCSSKGLRPFLREASGQDWTSLFEHSTIFLWWVSVIHLLMAKFLKYSTAPLFLRNNNPFIRGRDILHNALAKSGIAEHAVIFTEDIGIPGWSGG